jgi:hypothetical protein
MNGYRSASLAGVGMSTKNLGEISKNILFLVFSIAFSISSVDIDTYLRRVLYEASLMQSKNVATSSPSLSLSGKSPL